MERGHVIESLNFEVDFARETDAQALHTRYGDFAAGRGLAVIREVFDEFSGADEVLRLDTLEVDLGETPPVWDEAEAEARLREALRRALDGLVRPRGADKPGPAPRVDPAAAELELVWAHLHHGLLSWQAGLPSPAAFDALVLRVLATEGEALARRLRASPAAARLIARLVRQWPSAAVAQLAGLLSAPRFAGGAELPTAIQTEAEAPSSAEAWAARLLALATGVAIVDDAATPGRAADAARRRAASTPELSAAAWPGLVGGEPEAARARLRAAGRDAAWRARLAGLLTPERRRQLLALWGPPAEAEFILGVLAQPQAWWLGAARTMDAVEHGLLAALVDHLVLAAGDRVDAGAAVVALVTARAKAEGLAPAVVAHALAASWPGERPAADLAPRLRAVLAAAFGFETPPATTADRPARAGSADTPTPPTEPTPQWRLDLEPRPQDAEAVRDAVWRRRLRQEPAGLAAQLRERGRTAAQRRRLARDLTPARMADLLSLWFDPADAAFVDAVVAAADAWAQAAPAATPSGGAADLALRLREWLLEALLLAPAQGRLAAETVIETLLRRRAAFDDLTLAAAARSLIGAWPADGPVAHHRARLLAALQALQAPQADLADAPAADGSEPAAAEPPPSPERRAARAALERAFAGRAFADATLQLREALAQDRAWLATAFAARAGDGALRRALGRDLPTTLLFALVQPGLSEQAARLLLAAAPAPALGADAERVFWDDVLAALWPNVDGGVPPMPMGAASLLRRLLRGADPQVRQARRQGVRAARAYVRDAPIVPRAAPARAAAPSLAAWAERLPERPSAAVTRAAAALLVPPAAGLAQLAGLAPAARRALIARLRPTDAPAAFAALDALDAAARAGGLREPADGWAGFAERILLRELFEEDRPFAAEGFATRWFAAWLARAPETDAARARRALANALEAAAIARASSATTIAQPSDASTADARAIEAPGGDPDIATAQPAVSPAPTEPKATPSGAEVGRRAGSRGVDLPAESSAAEVDATAVQPPASPPTKPEVTPPVAEAGRPALPPGVDLPAETAAPEGGALVPTRRAAEAVAADQPSLAEPRPVESPDPRTLAEALRAEAADLAADAATEAPDAEPEPEADGAIYLDNAGVVLAGPYIPMLFDRLRLTRAGRFVDDAAVERAVHLLQFMVDGEEVPAPEHRLALNKLLCGLDFRTPLGREFRIEDHEREAIESLLRAMIERWSIIGRTSVAGLRESFFQRQGVLTAEPEAWRLKVQPRAFDMLIDQIPWGFATQRMPWMAQVLYVDWR